MKHLRRFSSLVFFCCVMVFGGWISAECPPNALECKIIIRPVAWQTVDQASPNSGGIKCLIGNLEGNHLVDEIDLSTIRLNGLVPILRKRTRIHQHGLFDGHTLQVAFDQYASLTALGATTPGNYAIEISGLLHSGEVFCGWMTIKITGDSPTCDCSATGDCNSDGALDGADVVYLISYAFRDGPAPPTDDFCPILNRGDFNGDMRINILDVVLIMNFVYHQPAPGPSDPCLE